MKYRFLYIFFLFLTLQSLNAQYANKSIKAYSQIEGVISILRSANSNNNNKIVLPPINITRNVEDIFIKKNRLKTFEFAKKRTVNIKPSDCGEIIKTENGRFLWQMTLISRGAKSIGLHFDKFDLPDGASLFIRGNNEIKGAYTAINNGKELQISPISGDSIVIEYDFPENSLPIRDSIPISVDEIYHDYLDVFSFLRNNNYGEPFFDYNNQALDALVCAPNIVNYPNVNAQSRGVVLLVVNGTSIGTGSLINNKRNDGTPYILTASHVVNNNFFYEDEIEKVESNCNNIVVFFNFASTLGDKNIRATEEQSLFGTSLVAYNKDVDMALLKIEGLVENENRQKTIPKEYRPYFNGWNLSETPNPPYFSIHHPLGTTKRYSQAKGTSLNIEDYGVWAGYLFKNFEKKHWIVKEWEIGTTDAGSSGSPLFDGHGLIIGALTGGASSCSEPYNDAYYSINRVWVADVNDVDKRKFLSYWLDPDGSGDTYCEGIDGTDSDKIKLLTRISGRKHVKDLKAIKIDPDYNNIGNLYNLNKGDRILGAFLTFYGTKSLYDNFPNITISLSEIHENKKGSELIKKTVTQPQYMAYDRETKKNVFLNRWLDGDTCQIFVPLKDLQINDSGNYLLQIQSSSGLNRMNIMGIDTEIQDDRISKNSSFIVDDNNNLRFAYDGKISSWIDLLIERNSKNGTHTDDVLYDVNINLGKISYFYDGRIYVNPAALGLERSRWHVNIWDLYGIKVFDSSFGEWQQVINVKDKLVEGVYIVKVTIGTKDIYYKIRV